MTFVVENGTGLINANSYASVAAADAYATLRGITAWTGTNTVKESALVRATDYLEATYREAWRGYRYTGTQALSWPRSNVEVDLFPVPSDIVPVAVVNACIELAIRALTESLLDDQGQKVRRERVDVIEIEYADGSDPAKKFPIVSRMISPYTYSGSNEGGAYTARVIRT
jgi:hypothetical protein